MIFSCRRFSLPAFLLLALAALSPLAAQDHVQATLTAATASVQPGHPVTVALRLQHDPHWHTYWINPGTGYPTSLAWELPPGWTAGEIQWPTPKIIRDGYDTITGNGYDNVTYLPVTLTPPADLAPGGLVTFNASADWLMCADVCVPGAASVSLTLPVDATPPQVDPTHGDAIAQTLAALPREVPGIRAQATRVGNSIILNVAAAAGSDARIPADLWFFASDALVQYDEPQTRQDSPPLTATLVLPVSASFDGEANRLVGILRSSGSWTTTGPPLPGLAIDVPITTGNAATILHPADAATTRPVAPLMGTLALAFVGGLILNLMPCVFPVLGIKILGFVNQAGSDRRKVALHGLMFAAGVFASFWALAAVLAILRAGGDELGWGFQLQSPAFVFGLAVVMLVFALSMSGVFEFGLSATGVGAGLQSRGGYGGSFFTGVLATVVATPCSAPFLAPALGAALALSITESFLIFTVIALGLSVPYLLLSLFPAAVKILPRPGAWMETFKQAMAFPLYATVGYLAWVLAGQTTESGFLMTLFGLTLIAMAVWLYGRYNAPGARPARARFGLIGGFILLAGGLALGWPQAPAPTDIVWQKWSPEAVAAAQKAGKPIYVDFTARWCATCQANKKIVFSSDEVKKTFRDRDIVTLKGDWTNQDPAITAELAKWGRSAVPFNLIYLPGDPTPKPLPELLTPSTVLEALN